MTLTPQRFKDHCLIIVGDGGDADRILAKRRLAAGGRLAHFLTEGPGDGRVNVQAMLDDAPEKFTWQPPSPNMPISSFAKKLGGKARTFWTKIGPDGVEVQPKQKLILMAGEDGKSRHLELWDENGRLLVHMSGEIVMDVSKAAAKTYDVEVYNPEIQAFGTLSFRFLPLAMLVGFFFQIAKVLLALQLEPTAVEGQVPWFRGLMAVVETVVGVTYICVEMWALTLNGVPATTSQHALSNLLTTVAVMTAAYFQLSEFVCTVCCVPCILLVTLLFHFLTREDHPTRRLLPHIKWTVAHVFGTTGSFVLFAVVAQVYSVLLNSGFGFASSVLLSFMTAFAETGMIIFSRIAYDRLVHKQRDEDGQGPVAGDQTSLPCATMVMSAHGFAEVCRVAATFAGAVNGGTYNWITTTAISVMLNISARLGWSRYILIQITKYFHGGPKAMAIFAPTGWSKFHDEQKIYCGYLRFVFMLAFVAARAIAFYDDGLKLDGPKAPAFNMSATILIPALFLAEIIEDEIVTRELLPVNPAGPGLLKVNAQGDNADPAQLITLEHLVDVPNDPWKMSEVTDGSIRTSFSASGVGQAQKTPSLSLLETSRWSRLRHYLGQPRSLNPSPSLHGLREVSFMIHFSYVAVVASITSALIALLIGAGYMRGICNEPLDGIGAVFGIVWWDAPLPCE